MTDQKTAKLVATNKAKYDGLFKDRVYEVVREVDPDFLASKNIDKMQTPLGNRGQRGYFVRLVQGDPIDATQYSEGAVRRDKNGNQWFFVGKTVLELMRSDYGAVPA